jgi:hypothetical protein
VLSQRIPGRQKTERPFDYDAPMKVMNCLIAVNSDGTDEIAIHLCHRRYICAIAPNGSCSSGRAF